MKVFYDKHAEAALWGKNLVDQFHEVYSKQAKFCVIFISRSYAAKSWPNTERQIAQARAFLERREYILPVRIDHTELPGMPSTVHYVDARLNSAEAICDMIVAKLELLGPPSRTSDANKAKANLPPLEETRICKKLSYTFGKVLEVSLDIRAGDSVIGALREEDGATFDFEIVDEENLIQRASRLADGYEIEVHGSGDSAYYVKSWLVPHNGPWFLVLMGSDRSLRIVNVNLRRQSR